MFYTTYIHNLKLCIDIKISNNLIEITLNTKSPDFQLDT